MYPKVKSLALMMCVQVFMWMFVIAMAKADGHPLHLFSFSWWFCATIIYICGAAFEAEAYRHYSKPK